MDDTPDTSRSVHLSASAGSGKTRALTERYLALLELLDRAGLGIDQAVAITFTDKAAAEIKKRVMDRLPEPMLKRIVRGRQDLRISTIHSFCMNLLKRYPLEAGLPPDFGILDERDRAFKTAAAVESALEALDRDPAAAAALAHRSADDLADAAGFLLSIRSRLKRIEIDAGGPEGMLRSLEAGLALHETEADLNGLASGGGLGRTLPAMVELLRSRGADYDACLGGIHLQLAAAADPAAAVALAASLAPVYFRKDGNRRTRPVINKTGFGDRWSEYQSLYFAVQDLLVRLRDLPDRIRSGKEALALLRLFQLADERYRDLKLREGLLDFDDLEITAYRLLKGLDSPDILYWLDRKVLHYLVDEFQDTSDIQWAVLRTLTAEIFAGEGAEKPLRPTLFVVGDRKQSIYRFREANYRLIDVVRRMIDGLPEPLREVRELDRNYRSASAVVEAANRVFTALWKDDYQPAAPDRAGHRGSVRLVELLPSDPAEEGAPGLTEAEVLAREVRDLVERGTVIYRRDGDIWMEQRAGFGDCAILIQSRTRLKDYEAALTAAGIPFRVVGGIGFYDEDEVQAVLNVLFFLWNREDRLSLAAALASPLFGLNDADLADLLRDDGDLLGGLRRARPDAAKLLDGWSALAGLVPLAGLVHRIINDAGAYVRFGRRSTQAVFNLDKLLDTAREFDRRGYTTLQDFVDWVKNIRSTEQREATADVILPEGGGDVSIMTVHKAKGLEFPVVVLPGVNQKPRSVTHGPAVILDEDSGRGIRMAADGPLYDELWSAEQEELAREQERLLYVAMTRARDHLVMIGALGSPANPYGKHSWLASLRRAVPAPPLPGDGRPCLIVTVLPDGTSERMPLVALPDQRTERRRRDAAIDPRALLAGLAPVASARVPEWKKATDLLPAGREWALEQPETREASLISPFVRGTIFHRCLESIANTGACDLPAVAGEFPEFRSLPAVDRSRFLETAAVRLTALTGSDELAWIFRPQPGAYAELPFLLRRGNEIISGVIDRVVIRDGTGYVIDYKAIRTESDGTVQQWIDHYRPQVRVYCEAVKELFGLGPVEGYLLFLDSARLALTVKVS